jgi:aromatic-L-amino-acid/L-tryptophan decarboxylase
METTNNDLSIQSIQEKDSEKLIEMLNIFWNGLKEKRKTTKVAPGILQNLPDVITKDPYPVKHTSLENVFKEVYEEILPYCVNTANPLFLGYVTPPSLDITWLGNAIIAMLNQNVSFSALSPAGTAIEQYVVNQLCKLVGYSDISGGVIVSGGSTANLQALITARRSVLGEKVAAVGNAQSGGSQRIYCSTQIHRSIHKAAIIMGIGVENVVEIPCDVNQKIDVSKLRKKIAEDIADSKYPIAIVGAAGTRACGSFDDLKSLSEIAEENKIWFHVDGAYGAFLKLSDYKPKELDYLHLAHSITIDPHKLLFMPMDNGCLIVRDRQKLIDAFGIEGEYLEKFHPVGQDFCDFGIELGRSMKAFNVWLAFKYIGLDLYKKEFDRLLILAKEFKELLDNEPEFERIGPSESIIVCFRWNPKVSYFSEAKLNIVNDKIRTTLIKEGTAFLNGVTIQNQFALRICFSNFNTKVEDLKVLLNGIKNMSKSII